MPTRRPHVAASATQTELAESLAALRLSLELPGDFAPDALAEAQHASARLELPSHDLTAIEFVTIDPPGSTDLDQAVHIMRAEHGYVVHYAIADVPALVAPGGAVDREARLRGQTLYAADGRIPLHPPVISDDAGSLLPEKTRSAYVWVFALDTSANVLDVSVRRARVRSRARLSYEEAQRLIDTGSAPASIALLKEVGIARIELEHQRGGASLDSPDEEIVLDGDGYSLTRRQPLAVESWNAQISLMTGMSAASIMLAGGVGILRTMPAPSTEEYETFRTQTGALGLPWPRGQSYGDYLRELDRDDPTALAVLQAATSLFRGAGYVAFDVAAGTAIPSETEQSAIAAPYAHTTAPLRRLVDRWVLVICAALCAGAAVPQWARDSLSELPRIMAASSRRASELDSASINRVEAALLSDSIGQHFEATVLSVRGNTARVQLAEPAVTAECVAPQHPAPGSRITVMLVTAEIASGTVRFEAVA